MGKYGQRKSVFANILRHTKAQSYGVSYFMKTLYVKNLLSVENTVISQAVDKDAASHLRHT